MKPSVLLMVQHLHQGGSERQCASVALGLKDEGYDIHVAAMRPGGMRAIELASAGIPLPIFPVRSFISIDPIRSGLSFVRYLQSHKISVVHSFDVPSNVFAVPWARFARVSKVFASQRAHRDLTPKSLRPLEKLSDHLANRIIVNCASVREELIGRFKISPSKIDLVFNGIDTTSFLPDGPKSSLPFPVGSLVIGTLCALRPEKDLRTLIEAFAMIAEEFPLAMLLIVGSGPERAALEAASIRGRTYFAGSQINAAPWYRSIDIFVLPSLSEALSNSVLEAMASGCATVASRTGGNPELIEDLISGRLFEPGSVTELSCILRSLLADKALRTNFALHARQRTEQLFTLETSGRLLRALYGPS